MSLAVDYWRSELSTPHKVTWAVLSASTTFLDPLDVGYNPQARNLFIRTDSLRKFHGLPVIETAPPVAVCEFFDKSFYFDFDRNQLAFTTATGSPDSYRCFLSVSLAIRPTVNFHESPFAIDVNALASSAKAGVEILGPGVFGPGDRISIRSRDMASDGSLSDPVYYIYDVKESLMFALQYQSPAIDLIATSNIGYSHDGLVELGIAGGGPVFGNVLPVPCRLRHFTVALETGGHILSPGTLRVNFGLNGVYIFGETLAGSNASNSVFIYSFTNLTGQNLSPDDFVEWRFFSNMAPGAQFTIKRLIIDSFFEPGLF